MPPATLRRALPALLPRVPIPHPRNNGTWSGRQPDEHVTNQDHELDVHSSASKSGGRQRAAGDGRDSSAATEKDQGGQNEKAKKDHPEAPGPVIGMNDERGGVSAFFFGWGGFCGRCVLMGV